LTFIEKKIAKYFDFANGFGFKKFFFDSKNIFLDNPKWRSKTKTLLFVTKNSTPTPSSGLKSRMFFFYEKTHL
jgi:hypothetical protein